MGSVWPEFNSPHPDYYSLFMEKDIDQSQIKTTTPEQNAAPSEAQNPVLPTPTEDVAALQNQDKKQTVGDEYIGNTFW